MSAIFQATRRFSRLNHYYLRTAARRIRQGLYQLSHNDDEDTTALADKMLTGWTTDTAGALPD